MLLVIPVYLVMFKQTASAPIQGIIVLLLFLALGPIQFFLFEQFFQGDPAEGDPRPRSSTGRAGSAGAVQVVMRWRRRS